MWRQDLKFLWGDNSAWSWTSVSACELRNPDWCLGWTRAGFPEFVFSDSGFKFGASVIHHGFGRISDFSRVGSGCRLSHAFEHDTCNTSEHLASMNTCEFRATYNSCIRCCSIEVGGFTDTGGEVGVSSPIQVLSFPPDIVFLIICLPRAGFKAQRHGYPPWLVQDDVSELYHECKLCSWKLL